MSEQESAVDHLVELAAAAEVNLVVIAGDLYDRAIPPGDAVGLFDDALVRLHGTGARIVAIAGCQRPVGSAHWRPGVLPAV